MVIIVNNIDIFNVNVIVVVIVIVIVGADAVGAAAVGAAAVGAAAAAAVAVWRPVEVRSATVRREGENRLTAGEKWPHSTSAGQGSWHAQPVAVAATPCCKRRCCCRARPCLGLIGPRELSSGRCRGEVLVEVVLQVAEGVLRLHVHALVQLLPHLVVFGKGFVPIVRCHLHVFRLPWLSLCLKCIASGFGEDAVRLDRRHLLVG